jgi:hypothetical protein
MSNRGGESIRCGGSGIGDAFRFNGFQQVLHGCHKLQHRFAICPGNDAPPHELGGDCTGVSNTARVRSIAKEKTMRNRILAIAAIATAIGTPITAQAQGTVGVVRGDSVIVDSGGIAVEQRPAFREYVVRERVPTYTIPDRVIVGGVLPEAGITYYDVPQTYGATPYRYTVVNGQTVLVEPRSRRIVQVID